jgi:hypothetical protein
MARGGVRTCLEGVISMDIAKVERDWERQVMVQRSSRVEAMFCDWIAGVGELVVLALEVEERHAGERRSASFVECHHVSVETRSEGVHFSCLQLRERVQDANHPLKQACSSTNPAMTLVRSRPLPGAAPVVAFRVKELRPRHSTTLALTAHGASTSPPPCGREPPNRVGDMDFLRGPTFPCQPSRRDRSSSNVGGPLEGSDNGGRGLGHHQREYSHAPSADNPWVPRPYGRRGRRLRVEARPTTIQLIQLHMLQQS